MEFYSANDRNGALEALAEHGAGAALIAGGTDVMLQLQRKEMRANCLVHLERIDDLRGVDLGEYLRIGALTTHRELATDAVIRDHYLGLAEAAAQVGGWQTRSVGTVGGNICNASPAADLLPPLLVHNARVVLQSQERGERELPLAEFVTGRRSIAREADELVTELRLDAPEPHCADIYLKLGRRGATEIAIVGLAVRLRLDPSSGTIADARVATCATGPVPARCEAAEVALTGSNGGDATVETAGAALLDSVSNIDDVRATASYRDRVLSGLLGRAVAACLERARESNN